MMEIQEERIRSLNEKDVREGDYVPSHGALYVRRRAGAQGQARRCTSRKWSALRGKIGPRHTKTSLSGRLECAASIIRGAEGEKGIDLS